jgi:hypothetical protein
MLVSSRSQERQETEQPVIGVRWLERSEQLGVPAVGAGALGMRS